MYGILKTRLSVSIKLDHIRVIELDNEEKREKEKKDKAQLLLSQNPINKKPKLLEKPNNVDLPPFLLFAPLPIPSKKPPFNKVDGR